MNKVLGIFKYQCKSSLRSVLIFYGIFISIIVFLAYSFRNSNNVTSAGLELSSAIFLFVCGLNSFKSQFYFSQLNNISRKAFLKGTVLYAAVYSTTMAIIDIIINRIYNVFIPCPMNYDMIYSFNKAFSDESGIISSFNYLFQTNNDLSYILKTFIFNASAYLFVFMVGLILTMITFKLNAIGKTIFWGGGAAILILSSSSIFSHAFVKIGEVIYKAFGVANGNSFMGVITLLISILILIVGQYLLIRRVEANKF